MLLSRILILGARARWQDRLPPVDLEVEHNRDSQVVEPLQVALPVLVTVSDVSFLHRSFETLPKRHVIDVDGSQSRALGKGRCLRPRC